MDNETEAELSPSAHGYALRALRADLLKPPATADLASLMDLWRHDQFAIRCERPAQLEHHPDLAVRVRGAFGNALMRQGPLIRGRVDPFERPSAFDVLFCDHGIAGLARPFVIDVDVGRDVVVTLRVVGDAMLWSQRGKEALIAALAGGVSLGEGRRTRVPLRPLDIEAQRVDGLVLPQVRVDSAFYDVTLVLKTPLVIRNGQSVSVTAHGLASAIGARVRAMAVWQGLELLPELDASSAAFELDLNETYPVTIKRRSARQVGREIPVTGLLGLVRLTRVDIAWLRALSICELMHLGSHAGLGLGRFTLAAYPGR